MKLTKRENFIKIAERRTNEILNKLDLFKNFDNTSYYEATNDDFIEIFDVIQKKLDEVKTHLIKANHKSFKLSNKNGELENEIQNK